MLFNSFGFIGVFFPIFLLAFAFSVRYGTRTALGCVIGFSAVFYGWHIPGYLLLITSSIFVNYWLSTRLAMAQGAARTAVLVVGLVFDFGLLGVFKYTDLVLSTYSLFSGQSVGLLNLALPLAISFFTFQQAAYLIDVWRRDVEVPTLLNFAAFVLFFPHLIAGPILRFEDLHKQLATCGDPERRGRQFERIGEGFALFSLGLAKKLLLADIFAGFANPVFHAADAGQEVDTISAWFGVLAFSLQIYFDFSGYSDMAIGMARMFGFDLPTNFNSPYKAKSVQDFWRRWHITLSTYLRDYLYIPLGGNRKGPGRAAWAVLITMGLGGLWHGASWNFLLWGLMHGSALVVHRELLRRGHLAVPQRLLGHHVYNFFGWLLTQLVVLVAWIFSGRNPSPAGSRS